MKKNLLIALVLIVTIISLTCVLVACNPTVDPVEPDLPKELVDTTFYTLASQIDSDTMTIHITSKDEDLLIYERNSQGVEKTYYGIQMDTVQFVEGAASLDYKAEAFTSTRIVEAEKSATLIAEVKTPKEFLGITDSDVTISTATVVIQINKVTSGDNTTYSLKEITVDYEMTISGITYVVESTVKA